MMISAGKSIEDTIKKKKKTKKTQQEEDLPIGDYAAEINAENRKNEKDDETSDSSSE
jgi:hypothetical protein